MGDEGAGSAEGEPASESEAAAAAFAAFAHVDDDASPPPPPPPPPLRAALLTQELVDRVAAPLQSLDSEGFAPDEPRPDLLHLHNYLCCGVCAQYDRTRLIADARAGSLTDEQLKGYHERAHFQMFASAEVAKARSNEAQLSSPFIHAMLLDGDVARALLGDAD